MKYDKPQTVYVRAAAVNIAKPSAMDKNPAPRIVPEIPTALQREIAGCVEVADHGDGTRTYYLMFAWPTHDVQQDAIATALAKLAKATTWALKTALPVTQVDVKESVPDLSKPPVLGVQPTKEVTVKRSVQTLADRVRFVGDVDAVEPVEKVAEKIIEK
jgi:hypothetical protein